MNNTSGTSVTPHVDKPKLIDVTPHSKKLHASISSHSVPQPREFNVVKHMNVIAPEMFKIDPSQTSRLSPVNALNSRANNPCANASPSANQKRHKTQRLHLLHMDLCGLMGVASINGKDYA
nr:hypothetical protein [Tanacetum cinerariifolium]